MENNTAGALILIAASLVALLGQWIKSHEKWDSRLAVLGMGVAGMIVYGVRYGWPSSFAWESVDFWLNKAWIWGLLLPGLASSIGAFIPWLKTDSKP